MTNKNIPTLSSIIVFLIHIAVPLSADIFFTNIRLIFLTVLLPALCLLTYMFYYVSIKNLEYGFRRKAIKRVLNFSFAAFLFFGTLGTFLFKNNIEVIHRHGVNVFIKGFNYTPEARALISELDIKDDRLLLRYNNYDINECWTNSSLNLAYLLLIFVIILIVVSFDVVYISFYEFKKYEM